MRFAEKVETVPFTGLRRIGKTHLAIALGLEAVRVRYTVYFITLSELAGWVPRDRTGLLWVEKPRVLTYPQLFIIDEVGYVSLDVVASYFVFLLVCRRYEKGAMIWTSNKAFAEWASVFAGDEVLAATILDRLCKSSDTYWTSVEVVPGSLFSEADIYGLNR